MQQLQYMMLQLHSPSKIAGPRTSGPKNLDPGVHTINMVNKSLGLDTAPEYGLCKQKMVIKI